MGNRKDQDLFHKTQLTDPQYNFDYRETTISHLFRYAHPALDNHSYGGQLINILLAAKLTGRPVKIFEIGAGLGWLARGILDELKTNHPKLYDTCSYTIMDLSTTLISAQRKSLSKHKKKITWIKGNAEKLPMKNKSFAGVIIANEVIADFEAVELDRNWLRSEPKSKLSKKQLEATRIMKKYRLDVGVSRPRKFYLNLGAIKFVEEIARVLGKKGSAFLTEYGGNFPPKIAKLSDPKGIQVHIEFSIRFDHLEKVGKKLGLAPKTKPLIDFMKFDKSCRVASYTDIQKLRFIDPGLQIYCYPYNEVKQAFDVLPKFFGFRFPKINSKHFPDENEKTSFAKAFHAITLKRKV